MSVFMTNRSPQRVLVVGGGHNGLVWACTLAERGVEGTVLEHSPQPGGGVGSGQPGPPGFVHDHCAGFMPVAVASPAMQAMELERYGVEWIAPESVMAPPFEAGPAIELNADVAATARSLDRTAPGAGAAWTDLMDRLLPHAETISQAIFTRFPPLGPAARLGAALRRDAIELARQGLGSAEAFGIDLWGERNDRATAWLCGSPMHSGLEPRAAVSGGFGFLLMLLAHRVRWPFPRGGAGRITDALVQRLGEHGGELRCDGSVERIEVRGGGGGGGRPGRGGRPL